MKRKIKENVDKIYKLINNYSVFFNILSCVALILIGALVFYFKYPFAYSFSNFYAEDGSIFVKNIIEHGFVNSTFSLFNGYFVIGQYIVAGFGFLINAIFGHGFVTLAKAIAVSSYLFWGFVCVIPWVLFRKKFGMALTLILTMLLWLTPLGGYDYAVIGTIGNLKFAFLFIATILVLYRNDNTLCSKTWQLIFVDIALVLCVMTNIVSLGLLPVVLWRYRNDIKLLFSRHKIIISKGIISVICLYALCLIYFLAVYLHGIPKMPGYLDGPLDKSTLIAIMFRGSFYGLLFPISKLFNDILVLILFAGFSIYVFRSKYREELLVISYVLIINVIGFVYNRPGVTEFFKTYNDSVWPGHFFYAGTMLFLVGCIYMIKDRFKEISLCNKLSITLLTVYSCILFMPASGSMSQVNRYTKGDVRPTLAAEVERLCSKGKTVGVSGSVDINLFPSNGWVMSIDRSKVCE